MTRLTVSTCKLAIYEGDGKSRFVIWDGELKGFGIRVYPSGRKKITPSATKGPGRRNKPGRKLGGCWSGSARAKIHKRLVRQPGSVAPPSLAFIG